MCPLSHGSCTHLYGLFSMKKIQRKNIRDWLLISVILLGLSACTSLGFEDKYPRHSFSFDTLYDAPDAEVLDYQYGTSRQFGTHADNERVALGQVFRAWDTTGAMPRGEFLIVKWRIKNPGNPSQYIGYYEDQVDLRKRLPADITGHRVHFVIKGPQLYVYLISPGLKLASEPAGPVRMYPSRKQIQIYPDQPK